MNIFPLRGRMKVMKTITASSIKASFTWQAGNAPSIDPSNPVVEVLCGSRRIIARIGPRNARKLLPHDGPGRMEGKLALIKGRLELVEAPTILHYQAGPRG
jgi:hypothetical protein